MDRMTVRKEAEISVAALLAKARETIDFKEAAEQTSTALEIAHQHGVRIASPWAFAGGGVSGHYARIDASRIGITALILIGLIGVVIWSLVDGDATAAAIYVSPLTGLAGICLGGYSQMTISRRCWLPRSARLEQQPGELSDGPTLG